MKNITYIISNVDKALAFEWISEELNRDKFNLSFILLNPGDSVLERYLKEKQIPVARITYRGKKDVPKTIFQLIKWLKKYKTQVIHTHLFDASLIGLFAGKLLGIKKRIYTRHYSTFHYEYFPKGVKYDRWMNKWATNIVAITQNVKDVLINREGVNPAKIDLIHHGFRLEEFEMLNSDKIEKLRVKYKSNNKYPVIGVIARQTHWKGIQYIIPAFKEVLKNYPNAYLILANAQGDYKVEINKLLNELSPDSFIEISFEQDLASLYQLFDVYVHTPVNAQIEAFGQTYIEALASGIPSVFTLSGVAVEFIKNRHNALVVDYKNSESVKEALLELLTQPELKAKLIEQGKVDVKKEFALMQMVSKLENLYEN